LVLRLGLGLGPEGRVGVRDRDRVSGSVPKVRSDPYGFSAA
jgi:hypothetical protein